MDYAQWLDPLEALLESAASGLAGDLDREQIQLYDLAFSRAELEAARAICAKAERHADLKSSDAERLAAIAGYFLSEIYQKIGDRLRRRPESYGLDMHAIPSDASLLPAQSVDAVIALGQSFLELGVVEDDLPEEQRLIRDTFRSFADNEVKPRAESIHRNDQIIPDEILNPLRSMGCFGLSVPERFGGLKPDNREDSVGMVVVTEELSRGSLGAAGSLITRPEIMARAILEGGSESQKARWLPAIAAGDPLCAISVTEPNTGSDVASVSLKATPTDGGWHLNGAKTWCTFAGKAGMILVLARTDPDVRPPHRGLSLFVVEKPSTDGHDFAYEQEDGGSMTGRSISTLGYRGMHSYEMFYDNFFVPSENLIGEAEGEGKGFYFTMRGFMGGRLQTAARASGLMRAAYESAASYSKERTVFGKSVAQYPLSLQKIARMGTYISVCKAFTLEVARLMDEGKGAMEASLVKLLACRYAEWVTREALQLYGGMGYAEETDVSRYFTDARVLSIFEGAEETLAVRVVGKALVEATR